MVRGVLVVPRSSKMTIVAGRRRSVPHILLSTVTRLLVILALIEAEEHVGLRNVLKVEGRHDAVSANDVTDRGLIGMPKTDVFLNASLSAESSTLSTEARTKKRHECMGIMVSLSRKCRRIILRKAARSDCTREDECNALYDKCYDRLRRKHFIKEEGCGDKETLGRISVPTCTQSMRFISTDARQPTTREQLMFARLSNITDPTVLSNPDSPQGQAYNWITQEDGLQLSPTDPTLEQRYILASLYYSTNGDGWGVCFQGALENECRREYNPFLSANPECTWYGISCRGGANGTYVERIELLRQQSDWPSSR